jgi:hypothetical protein
MSGRQTLFKEKDGSGVVSVLFSSGRGKLIKFHSFIRFL